jgi:hypothetical protein
VALKSCGGTRGKTYKTVIETNIDELFIVTKELGIYIFLKEELKNKSTLNICGRYEKYRVNY